MKLTPEERAEYAARTSLDLDPEVAFFDPVWRIANRYRILSADGKDVPFRPNEQQIEVTWAIFVRGWQRIIIPKARQLGMSTLLSIIALDGTLWKDGCNAALIDKTGEDADKKHREKILFAWDRVDPYEKSCLIEDKRNSDRLVISRKPCAGEDKPPESTFSAGINFRGGTLEFLWISEWGYVQNVDRQRSIEIKNGALPAVEKAENGVCVIETTWQGGLDGELGSLVTEAQNTPEHLKGPKSWRIMFFPWYNEPTYRQKHGQIDGISAAYFRDCARRGVVLDEEQMLWYAEKRRTATSAKSIKEEYPTFVDECWENVPEGSIYGREIEQARAEQRIISFLYAKDYPVHTFWDIGAPINTACWLAQVTPHEVRLIDALFDVEMTMEQRAAWFRGLPYDFGNHYFPHDADTSVDSGDGQKPIQKFRKVFGPGCFVVPRIHNVWTGISDTQANFNRFKFRADMQQKHDPKAPFPLDAFAGPLRMKLAVEALGRYRFIKESSTGIVKNEPLHDRYSHLADALRQLGQTLASGRVEHANAVGRREFEPGHPRLQIIHAGSRW